MKLNKKGEIRPFAIILVGVIMLVLFLKLQADGFSLSPGDAASITLGADQEYIPVMNLPCSVDSDCKLKLMNKSGVICRIDDRIVVINGRNETSNSYGTKVCHFISEKYT